MRNWASHGTKVENWGNHGTHVENWVSAGENMSNWLAVAGLRGLVFKAHRRLYHSTLGSRVVKKKKHLD